MHITLFHEPSLLFQIWAGSMTLFTNLDVMGSLPGARMGPSIPQWLPPGPNFHPLLTHLLFSRTAAFPVTQTSPLFSSTPHLCFPQITAASIPSVSKAKAGSSKDNMEKKYTVQLHPYLTCLTEPKKHLKSQHARV